MEVTLPLLSYSNKIMSSYQRYDALLVGLLPSHHGVALARSRLPVRKYAHVVAFESVEQHLLANVLVHLHLGRIVDVLGLYTQQKYVFKWLICDFLSGWSTQGNPTDRSVRPVGIVEVEALVFFWLFGVQDRYNRTKHGGIIIDDEY